LLLRGYNAETTLLYYTVAASEYSRDKNQTAPPVTFLCSPPLIPRTPREFGESVGRWVSVVAVRWSCFSFSRRRSRFPCTSSARVADVNCNRSRCARVTYPRPSFVQPVVFRENHVRVRLRACVRNVVCPRNVSFDRVRSDDRPPPFARRYHDDIFVSIGREHVVRYSTVFSDWLIPFHAIVSKFVRYFHRVHTATRLRKTILQPQNRLFHERNLSTKNWTRRRTPWNRDTRMNKPGASHFERT